MNDNADSPNMTPPGLPYIDATCDGDEVLVIKAPRATDATFWLLWWTNAEGKAIVKIDKKGVTMLIKGKEKTFVPDGFADAWALHLKEMQRLQS